MAVVTLGLVYLRSIWNGFDLYRTCSIPNICRTVQQEFPFFKSLKDILKENHRGTMTLAMDYCSKKPEVSPGLRTILGIKLFECQPFTFHSLA